MLRNYSLLRAIVGDRINESLHKTRTHYNFIARTLDQEYQVNIDIQSSSIPNVSIYCIENFSHPILRALERLTPNALSDLACYSDVYHADYLRSTMFPSNVLHTLTPTPQADLADFLHNAIVPHYEVYILGEYYDNSQEWETIPYGLTLRETYTDLPPKGIHNIHMNQGSTYSDPHVNKNGIYQDGALFLKESNHTRGFFFLFSEQCLTTDAKGECVNSEHSLRA